jgi:hypothetical protein
MPVCKLQTAQLLAGDRFRTSDAGSMVDMQASKLIDHRFAWSFGYLVSDAALQVCAFLNVEDHSGNLVAGAMAVLSFCGSYSRHRYLCRAVLGP